jgi:hypothetical protein
MGDLAIQDLVQGLHELGMKPRRLSAERLILPGMPGSKTPRSLP